MCGVEGGTSSWAPSIDVLWLVGGVGRIEGDRLAVGIGDGYALRARNDGWSHDI